MAIFDSEIFGREEELASVADALAVQGLPRAVLLEGEAGIGKTTLWQRAVSDGSSVYTVLSCRPAESEAQLSFAALYDLLGETIQDTLPELPPPRRRALEVALRLADTSGAAHDRMATSFGFLDALHILARSSPLLIAIDDVQWLDPQSRLLLEFAFGRLEDDPVGILLSGREHIDIEDMLGSARVERVALGPLSLGAMGQLVRDRLGIALPRLTLRRIHEASGGNPFFALELTRALGGGPAPPPDAALPLTPGLEGLLERRLADVPPEVAELLLVCAASAAPTSALVSQAGAHGNALEDAIARDLLVADAERLRFSHPLIASAVYHGASDPERRATHRRLAELSEDPEARALHLCRATVLPDESVAQAIEDAADQAWSRSAAHAAGWLALQARRLTPADRADDTFRRGLKVCDYHRPLGTTPEIEQTIRELVDSAKPGAQRARALFEAASKNENVDEKLRLSDEALWEAGPDVLLEARIRGMQSRALEGAGRLDAAVRHALGQLESAEAAGNSQLIVEAIARVGRMRFMTGQGIDDALMRRGRELERTLSSFVAYHSATSSLADQLMWSDAVDQARALFENLLERATRAGAQNTLVTILLQLAELENRSGRWRAAEAHSREGAALAQDMGHESIRGLHLFHQALAWTYLGRLDEASELLAEASAISRGTHEELYFVHYESLLGFIALCRDDYEAGCDRLGPLPDRIEAIGARDPGFFYLVPNVVDALVTLGRREAARAEIARLERSGRRLGRYRALVVAARGRALLDGAEGNIDAALASFQEALEHHQGLPDPFEHGRTLFGLGIVQRRAKRRGEARRSLRAALDRFEELEAVTWADKARAELGRIVGRTPAGADLTPSESRIAELVAEGKTNKEVAAELFVSLHTVEQALTRVYRKLGIRSRTQLARRLAAKV